MQNVLLSLWTLSKWALPTFFVTECTEFQLTGLGRGVGCERSQRGNVVWHRSSVMSAWQWAKWSPSSWENWTRQRRKTVSTTNEVSNKEKTVTTWRTSFSYTGNTSLSLSLSLSQTHTHTHYNKPFSVAANQKMIPNYYHPQIHSIIFANKLSYLPYLAMTLLDLPYLATTVVNIRKYYSSIYWVHYTWIWLNSDKS